MVKENEWLKKERVRAEKEKAMTQKRQHEKYFESQKVNKEREKQKKIKAETKKEEIARMYRIFNFNLDDVSTRRQRDGV